jgi:adenylate cyclase
MTDATAKFAGVLRVGLLARQLDRAVQLDVASDPHVIVLCDATGALVTRGVAADRLVDTDDNLRIAPATLPPAITAALADPALATIAATGRTGSSQVRVLGTDYLTTFQPFPAGRTQDWIVGVIVPRAFYLGPLTAVRQRLLVISGGIIFVVIVSGTVILYSVRRAQGRITGESRKMNAFDFTPASPAAPFRDVAAVLASLERAKTAMRAMSKYVPVDLVRRLYQDGSEPHPGGTPSEISLMFTDIAGFTSITETLPAAQLAEALERYLDALAPIIQRETRGTIDKYIGDAIMTFWNAPEPVPDHARMACRAALRCRDAGLALATTPEWKNLPPFQTRFGLHLGTALVGHFGATDRLNYTAIGDAVNLASRLEGLNKLYGTTIIASEAIVTAAAPEFVFRLLDIVAVKGKQHAVRIYELLGGTGTKRPAHADPYEQAFARYLARDFAAARSLLAPLDDDPPSRVLLARCDEFLLEPPPEDWDGTRIATEK